MQYPENNPTTGVATVVVVEVLVVVVIVIVGVKWVRDAKSKGQNRR